MAALAAAMVTLLLACTATGALGVVNDPTGVVPPRTSQTEVPSESPAPTPPDPTEPEPTTPAEILDYSEVGPHVVSVRTEDFETSCRTQVSIYVPEARDPAALVVLAHGFARSKEQMAGWATHIASWGLPVVTPDLCGLLSVDHEQNAIDLVAVASAFAEGGAVLYAGHSAGGLAALLAVADDPAAVGVLGLDLTDAEDLGLSAAPTVPVPVGHLYGEPELCNAFGSGVVAVDAAPQTQSLHLLGADHCDFENPSDALCDIACANGTVGTDVVTDLVAGLGTAWLVGLSGDAPEALAWWTPGDPHLEALVADGLVAIP